MVIHLTGQSGEKGLKAFLPEKNLKMPGSISHEKIPQQPVLPFKMYFEHIDYSLSTVASGTLWQGLDRTLFVSHLIGQYNYLIAQGKFARSVHSTLPH